MDKLIRPQFDKAFRGFNQKQVNDYISRLESEIEIISHQQEKSERETANLHSEVERLKNQVNTAWTEAETMRSQNSRMTATIQELESALQEQKDAQARMRLELKQLRDSAAESDHDPQTIKAAILNAQRMAEIIVSEANQQADGLRLQADADFAAAQEKMEQLVQQKNAEAEELVSAAHLKCDELQREYDHILVDVSGFKAEMIELYRRHLELLYKLPDNGLPAGQTQSIPLLADNAELEEGMPEK